MAQIGCSLGSAVVTSTRMPEVRALEALSHPLVLRGAWLRVDGWYRSGNLAPQPELSRWRLHPEGELRSLALDLMSREWAPSPWPQVPYPKRGACLRHYTMPTVRDQVAFMAFLVLLAPWLDGELVNFAFGNRWYRPVHWNRRGPTPQWERRPYPLLTDKTYLPYGRSHGLYRRVAHWTVARMTKAQLRDRDFGGTLQLPDDYEDAWLPDWTRKDWWGDPTSDEQYAYWATLDLQLAYPSVRLSRLRESIRGLDATVPADRLSGFPESVCDSLARLDVLQVLGEWVVDALEQVKVDDGSIPKDAWCPCCAAPELPPENQGLPTGLAVSGLLMNAVLHSSDRQLLAKLEGREGPERSAVLRFADDMHLLSKSADGLIGLIDDVWRALAGDDSIAVASTISPSNLYLNIGKVDPPELAESVNAYLAAHGWKKCETCGQRRRPGGTGLDGSVRTLSAWLISGEDGRRKWASGLRRTAVGPNEVGPFVTTLVARLSDLGTDTLAERFGEGARTRLERLHELARFDIDDRQVRPETRRAFAANRLVRVWLPPVHESASVALSDIRQSIAYVLRETPWKFSLWRSVVRAAALRPVGASEKDNSRAAEWLTDRLRHIAHVEDDGDSRSWMNTWPERLGDNRCDRDRLWKEQYLSFHRAAFWHSLGDVLRELWRHHDRVERPRVGDAGPPPSWWTLRAIPGKGHKAVAELLGAVDVWADVLYPSDEIPDRLRQWPWELDQLVAAVLGSAPRTEVAEGLRCAERPNGALMVPLSPFRVRARRTVELLTAAGRVLPSRARARALNENGLAHIYLAGIQSDLAPLLFPAGRKPRVLGALSDPDHTIAVGVALGCATSIDRGLLQESVPAPEVVAGRASLDPLTLREYGRARRLLLGHETGAT